MSNEVTLATSGFEFLDSCRDDSPWDARHAALMSFDANTELAKLAYDYVGNLHQSISVGMNNLSLGLMQILPATFKRYSNSYASLGKSLTAMNKYYKAPEYDFPDLGKSFDVWEQAIAKRRNNQQNVGPTRVPFRHGGALHGPRARIHRRPGHGANLLRVSTSACMRGNTLF